MSDINVLMRTIPAMEELLNTSWAVEFSNLHGREYVKKIITEVLNDLRRETCTFPAGECKELQNASSLEELAVNRAMALLRERSSSSLKAVINATGVVIHTNLGRAPLAPGALKAVTDIAETYSTLEYSPAKGGRESRNSHVEWLICQITGSEASLVVNNNAAAVLLALSGLASGREVIVSSGELVEIGDSFRIPEILSFSGAKMTAVGCTNSTRLKDYSNAITENTSVLLKVHPSNYKISGFVTSVSREELAQLAASRSLVFMEDLGSGLLCSPEVPFANSEHSVRDCLEAGVNIVTFSGDKLLGGPQIGVIAGSKQIIDKIRSHQLLRALRVDKMTLAAFEATLRMYMTGKQKEIPVIRMIEADANSLQKKARLLCRLLRQKAKSIGADDVEITVVETADAIGGGAFPTDNLPGFGIGLKAASRCAESLTASFRAAAVPVIPALREDRVILHVRTLLKGDEQRIVSTFAGIFGKAELRSAAE